jgi:hypothetical protein
MTAEKLRTELAQRNSSRMKAGALKPFVCLGPIPGDKDYLERCRRNSGR